MLILAPKLLYITLHLQWRTVFYLCVWINSNPKQRGRNSATAESIFIVPYPEYITVRWKSYVASESRSNSQGLRSAAVRWVARAHSSGPKNNDMRRQKKTRYLAGVVRHRSERHEGRERASGRTRGFMFWLRVLLKFPEEVSSSSAPERWINFHMQNTRLRGGYKIQCIPPRAKLTLGLPDGWVDGWMDGWKERWADSVYSEDIWDRTSSVTQYVGHVPASSVPSTLPWIAAGRRDRQHCCRPAQNSISLPTVTSPHCTPYARLQRLVPLIMFHRIETSSLRSFAPLCTRKLKLSATIHQNNRPFYSVSIRDIYIRYRHLTPRFVYTPCTGGTCCMVFTRLD